MRFWLYLHSLSFPLATKAFKAVDLYLATTHRFLVRKVLLALFFKDLNGFDQKISTFSCFGTGGSGCKESAWNTGESSSIPGSGGSPGEGHGNPPQFSCLENPTDRGAWWATVHGVTESDTAAWLVVIVVDIYGSILSTARNASGFLQGSLGFWLFIYLKKFFFGSWLFKINTWIYLTFYTPTYTYIGILLYRISDEPCIPSKFNFVKI